MSSYWIKRNGRWVEEQSPTPTKREVHQAPNLARQSVEVRLFEAVRDVELALSEFRIGLAARVSEQIDRYVALRAALRSLESSVETSAADILTRLSVSRTVAGMRSALNGNGRVNELNPQAVGDAAKELRRALGHLSHLEARTDAGMRAKALAKRARVTAEDDERKHGLNYSETQMDVAVMRQKALARSAEI